MPIRIFHTADVHIGRAFDERQGCTIISTESVLAYLARKLHPARMVMVGQVNGVYNRDPLRNTAAQHIARITAQTFPNVEAQLGRSHGVDVTGGMLSKVREMISLVAKGHTHRVQLISGSSDGALTRALLDSESAEGTIIE